MTYVNAVKYLKSHIEGVPSPERMKLLCRYLGEPQRQMRFVHIAGSAGKTSCAIMLSTVLVECGYKIGRLTSPYTREYREMILINESPLSHKEFADNISKAVDAAKKMIVDIKAAATVQENSEIEPTSRPKITKNLLDGRISPEPISAEIICAAAFLAFRENDCNIAVLECGESRADPTSIIDPPLVSVVCGSSFSEEQLRTGTGIIRKGTREVVSTAPAGIAYSTVLDTCVKSGSRLTVPAHGELKINKSSLGGKSFEYRGKAYSVPFCSSYQLLNALTTIESVYALRRTGVALHSQEVASGIARARIPLRFEIISASPAIILDCAKNKSDFAAVVNSLSEIEQFIGKSIVLVTSQENSYVSQELFEQHGFSVVSTYSCEEEADRKSVAAKAAALSANEIMLVIGTPNFVDKIKTAILRSFSYRR